MVLLNYLLTCCFVRNCSRFDMCAWQEWEVSWGWTSSTLTPRRAKWHNCRSTSLGPAPTSGRALESFSDRSSLVGLFSEIHSACGRYKRGQRFCTPTSFISICVCACITRMTCGWQAICKQAWRHAMKSGKVLWPLANSQWQLQRSGMAIYMPWTLTERGMRDTFWCIWSLKERVLW